MAVPAVWPALALFLFVVSSESFALLPGHSSSCWSARRCTRLEAVASAMKGYAFLAITVDGKIARSDGDVTFLNDYPAADGDGDQGFSDFLGSIDAIIMGRKTFETVLGFGPDQYNYGEMPIFVLTTRRTEDRQALLPTHVRDRASYSDLSPADLWSDLERRGFRRVYVDGGRTLRSFLELGVVDEITLTTIPLVLGSGIPLFDEDEGKEVSLQPLHTQVFGNGLVQTRYRVVDVFGHQRAVPTTTPKSHD